MAKRFQRGWIPKKNTETGHWTTVEKYGFCHWDSGKITVWLWKHWTGKQLFAIVFVYGVLSLVWKWVLSQTGHVVSPNVFNPTKLSTDQWLRAARSFDAKYAVLTLDHFSGFLLWPTVTNYNYSVKDSKWRNKTGDVARDFVQSCAKYDIKHAFYYSVNKNWYMNVDHHRAPNPVAQAGYNRIVEEQMRELLNPNSKYANPFLFWFDAGIVPGVSPNIGPILRSLASDCICLKCPASSGNLGARWIGNEQAVAPLPLWYTVRKGGYLGK